MDTNWERATPIYDISLECVKDIFSLWVNSTVVREYRAIGLGCRNSNYIVFTQKGEYLLRILPDKKSYQNEINVHRKVADVVNVPRLYHTMVYKGLCVLIYEYIESTSLQKVFEDNTYDKTDIIKQVAESSAKIHNLGLNNTHGLLELDVPPFEMWYDYFLGNSNVKARLGSDIIKRVRSLIVDSKQPLAKIDKYQSLIHSDFRPANMIIDNNKIVYFVDWESACKGHILADIGQFFRYSELFSDEDVSNFKTHYNEVADVKLPKEFCKLSKLRDLVNPLQMLTSDADKPVMYRDLIDVVISTLEYFSK